MKTKNLILTITSILLSSVITAQSINPEILSKQWDAKWITVPDEPANAYGVFLFRKTFDVRKVPSSFIVHTSADNRYKLFVNEKLVSIGPARGDMYYWNFETVDIAPYLIEGNNIIAAKVWNEGHLRPEAQISWRSGFILQENTGTEFAVNTNDSWKCIRDTSYRALPEHDIIGYYVAGPGEFIDMRKNMKGWNRAGYHDTNWKNAVPAFWRGGSPKGLQDAFGWMLVPSPLPQMELSPERMKSVRESTGITVPEGFPTTTTIVTVPANTKATMLLDQGYLSNAYLTLLFSNGRDAAVTLKYAESLFIPAHSPLYGNPAGGYMGFTNIHGKGNRDEVKGKIFLGRKDSLISDGTLMQEFTTLYWRTYRYILITIETREDPLVINDIFGTFTGYPFRLNAGFDAEREDLQKILDIGWRTARLCALETYMDCPYYEQLQYIGDARIQALISLYNSGDERLVRNALNHMDHSRIPEGPTLSRHPSFSPQLIPTFSLWYIGMLHDYWMYGSDSVLVKDKIPGTRQVLDFFHRYQHADGSLIHVPYWNFSDWVENRPGWTGGVAPRGTNGNSCILDMQLLWAYQVAAELEDELGMKAYAQLYTQRAEKLAQTIQVKYWDRIKGMFADTPEKDKFSQHANTLAILTSLVTGDEAELLGNKMLQDTSLTQASIYFKYYLHLSLVKAGMGNDYLKWLDKWYENMAMGMTTWAEDSDINTARSDCHAWGASPNIEFYRIVLGIDSDAPGFSKVRITPRLGELKKVSGSIPHPMGKLSVNYHQDKGKLYADIILPAGLTGTFVWKGKEFALKEGENKLEL
jgi:alpha-L-rhamnosidase